MTGARARRLETARRRLLGQQRQRPPMAPSRFAERLQSLIFTNAADRGVVSELYRKTLEDGFGGLTALRYPKLDWGDAEAAELGATLREVRCPHVVELDLSDNYELRSAEALAAIVGELPALQTLDLGGCSRLAALRDALGQCTALQTLQLYECYGLTALPDLSGLPNLEVECLPDRLQPWEAGGRKAWPASD